MAYPTTTTRFLLGRCVQLPQTNSSSYFDTDGVVPDPVVVKEKITSLFSKVDTSILSGVLQFWAPITSCSGRRLLTTCNQPVSYNQQDSCVHKYASYRLNSRRYVYRIDDDNDMSDQEVERESLMMITGPTANAFVNHIAEAVMDISVEQFQVHVQGCPLMSSALECELKSYFVLPVFCPTTSSCVGVIECSMLCNDGYLQMFIQLTYALESVGLRTFHVQESPPYKTIPGLKCSINEIEEALRFVGEAHDLSAAQVWVPYNFVNHVNSSLEVTHAVKLTGYCVDLDDFKLSVIQSYCHSCDTLPLKKGDGLVFKTLQTYNSHFCTDINELSHNKQKRDMDLLGLLSITFKSSCFVICLRSINTGDLIYAFEFLWPRSRNYLILLESLLLTLKKCLPSFKFAHGTEIGDEMRVLDVGNSTGSGIGFFNILKGNRLSSMPQNLEERRLVSEDCLSSTLLPEEDVRQPLGTSIDEAAKNLSDWQWRKCVKRKISDVYERESDVYESECDSNEEDNIPNQDVLTLQVEYADDVFKLHLPISLETIVAVKEEINKRCKLNPGTYKIKYLDEDEEWILMNTDKHVRHCIRSWRTSNRTTIRVRVLPLTR